MNLFTRSAFTIYLLFLSVFSVSGQVSNFTADYSSGCAPLVVHFTNASSGASGYKWYFGNGTTSVLTNASSSYLSPGTYTCTLVAYNAAGTDSAEHTMTITVYPAPTVEFVANDTAVCPGAPVSFTSTGSAGVTGAVTYSWSFGDGASSTLAAPSHSFTTPGYKNITLSVTNSKGCVASVTLGALIDVFTPPVADFSATPNYVCAAPANLVFDNTSTGVATLSYTWTFGDLTSGSSATDPTHTYAATGGYSVKLVVTDGHGCEDSITRFDYINVGNLTGSFTAPASACVFAPVIFDNTTSGSGISSTWYFGTGASSTVTSPTYIFNTAGTYTVSLVVYNGHCYDTVSQPITILPAPVSGFTWAPLAPCTLPATVSYTGTAPSGSSFAWNFGGGSTASGSTVSRIYSSNVMDTIQMIVTDGSGCRDTVTHVDTVYNLKVGIGPLLDTGGCIPLNIHFAGYIESTLPVLSSYPYGISSYLWNFGDGSAVSSLAAPAHTFTAAGVYTVTLTLVTANGCTQLATQIIRTGTPPVTSFSAIPTTICYDTTVSFINTTTGANGYHWFFGDGGGDTITNPIYHYNKPDTFFTVMLVAYDNGCPDTLIIPHYITVDSPKAIMDFSFSCIPPTQVNFRDSSLGDNTHLWIFGDGTTSSVADPIHDFPALSIYSVTLTTYNAASGCRDTTSGIINLVKPQPHFTTPDTAVCKNSIVLFTSSVTGGTAETYFWAVNGITMYPDSVFSDSVFVDTFTVTGLYTIKLTIQDGEGCYDTIQKNNYIVVAKPVDSFVTVPPTGCWPLSVLFTDHSTDVAGTTFTNFKWAFGDGGTASVSTASTGHTYTTAGTFNVQEIVTDNIGCKDTITLPADVTVYKPTGAFYTNVTFPCIGVPDNFTNISTGIVSSYWMFGDGDTSTAYSPSNVYTATGVYTVKLVVTDVHGCTDTVSYPNYINVTKPTAAFYMTDSFSLCPPLSVNFINTSSGGATSYKWFFGDGATSVLVSPSDLYTVTEYDTVLLVAKNAYGCPDTAVGHVNLFGNSGGFSYAPLTGCSPLTVHFNASINNVPNIIWDFADGTTTLAAFSDTISHTYTIPGAYVPKLVLSDNTGCEKSSQGLDTIKVDAVKPGFTTLPAACLNTSFTFKDTSSSYFSSVTSWHWSFSGDTSDLSAPPYTYTAIGTFPVSLTVTDAWGCTAAITENITVFPLPDITVSPDTLVCAGDPAALTGYGGVSYTWAPAGTVSCSACPVTQATPTVVTQYTVTGTDLHGCRNTDTTTVLIKTKTNSRSQGDTAICQGETVTLDDTGATKYTWIPPAGLNNADIADPSATPATTTTYTVIAQLGSCIPDTNYVTVTVHPLPTVNAGNDQTLVSGTQAQIEATGTSIASYTWYPDESLSCKTCPNPLATPSVTTTYTVDVSSSYGCRNSDTVTIHLVCDKSQVFIPNSFTPNGDGQDDVFYPRGTGISIIKSFRIYNRWGELLFERDNININDASNAWDGTYNSATPRADVYVYIVDAICDTGSPINLKGDVTIIR